MEGDLAAQEVRMAGSFVPFGGMMTWLTGRILRGRR